MTSFIAEQEGERLDVFVARRVEGLSRAHAQKLIADGCVTVDGAARRPSARLAAGARVAVELPPPKAAGLRPEALPLSVLYEDADVIVLDKARGMVVHPAPGSASGTLVNALLAHCGDLSGVGGTLRPGIVHRLDKDTSGVMIAAKNDAAHLSLAEQIRTKAARRVYWAIVCGNIREEAGEIRAPIGRSPKDRQKMAVVRENGKDAVTRFRVLERFGDYTLAECRLLTGRTHQIRVHMAYIGHPVLGDPKYGPGKCPFAIRGQALHSMTISFTHPTTGAPMRFAAPLPADMEEILRALRARAKG